MKHALTTLALSAFLAGGVGAAPSTGAGDGPIVADPNIAKASAEADADAGTPDGPESPESPYAKALLNYKTHKYDAALVLINQADREQPGNVPILMLKVRVLGELEDFKEAHRVLNDLYNRPDLTPAYAQALMLTTGDLALRERHFDAATKAYQTCLQTQPDDAEVKLKLIYARIGDGDLVTAEKIASELKPLDAASPAYYFARAAIAHSSGGGDEEQDIEQARTIYGITLANLYLKTYLEVFADHKAPPAPATESHGATTHAAPSGLAQ